MPTKKIGSGTSGAPGTRTSTTTTTPMNNSGSEATSTSWKKILSNFECPVCTEYALPPIFQCCAGHLICSKCHPKLSSVCPICRGPLGNIRNFAMEGIANTVRFPCKHASRGCCMMLVHTDKIKHEDICEHRPYECPFPGSVSSCKWQGPLDQVKTHLMSQHKAFMFKGEHMEIVAENITRPDVVERVIVQHCFGQHFMFVLARQDKPEGSQLFANVQLIGSRKDAEKFAFRLELKCGEGRLLLEDTTRSIDENMAATMLNLDCLVFGSSFAQLLAENVKPKINVIIRNKNP